MSDKIINRDKQELTEHLELLKSKERELRDDISMIQQKLNDVRFREEEAEMAEILDDEDKVKYFLFEDGCVDGKRYEERERFWWDRGFFIGGYNLKTQQVCLEILLEKRDDAYAWARQMEEVYPYIYPDFDGKVVMHVMDSYFKIIFDKETFYIVEKTNNREIKKSNDLEDIFEYLIALQT